MAVLDKEIRVIALKGERGQSSYELAVEEELFSGTLQEWIETFATPENYITRTEFQKVTQAQYDAMAQAGTLVANCYYLIIDDTTAQDFEDLQDDVSTLKNDVSNLQDDVSTIQGDISNLQDDVSNLQTKLTITTTIMSCSTACQKYFSNNCVFLNATVTYPIDDFGLDYVETNLIFDKITQNGTTTYRAYYIKNGVLTLYNSSNVVSVSYIEL